MSNRAAMNKSRLDKAKTTQGNPSSVTQVQEIIAGRYNDNDWQLSLDKEEYEDYGHELINEIVDSAWSQIYQRYLDSQLIPYTVSLAKEALVKIIEWQFLTMDPGEDSNFVLNDPSWGEDTEPDSCKIDSLAQGSISKRPADLLILSHQAAGGDTLGSAPIMPEISTINEEYNLPEPSEEEIEKTQLNGKPADTPLETVEELREPSTITNSGEKMVVKSDKKASPQNMTQTSVQEDSTSEVARAKKSTEQSSVTQKATVNAPGATGKTKVPVKFKPYRGKPSSASYRNITESLMETEMRLAREDEEMERQKRWRMEKRNRRLEKYGAVGSGGGGGSSRMGTATGNDGDTVSVLSRLSGGDLESWRQQQAAMDQLKHQELRAELNQMRFGPEQLPQHRVRVPFRIVDTETDAAHTRFQAIKMGHAFDTTEKSGTAAAREPDEKLASKKPSTSQQSKLTGTANTGTAPATGAGLKPVASQTRFSTAGGGGGGGIAGAAGMASSTTGTMAAGKGVGGGGANHSLIDPLPNTVIDMIQLMPGVMVQEGERVKKGPFQKRPMETLLENSMRNLKPLKDDQQQQVNSGGESFAREVVDRRSSEMFLSDSRRMLLTMNNGPTGVNPKSRILDNETIPEQQDESLSTSQNRNAPFNSTQLSPIPPIKN